MATDRQNRRGPAPAVAAARHAGRPGRRASASSQPAFLQPATLLAARRRHRRAVHPRHRRHLRHHARRHRPVDPVDGLARQRHRGADHRPARLRRLRRSPSAVGAVAGLLSRPRPCPAARSRPSSPRWRWAASCSAPRWSSPASARSRSPTPSAAISGLDHRHAPSASRTSSSSASSCSIVAHVLQSRTALRPLQRGDRRRRAGGLRLRRQGQPAEGHRLRALRRRSRRLPASSSPGASPAARRRSPSELLLPSIAAVVVGGTAITGGVGSIWRTLVGALIISVVRIGMTFLGVNIFAQQIVFGAVLIVAVAITIDRSKIPIVK